MNEKVKEIVVAAMIDDGERKKLHCKTAFEIAEEHGLNLADISSVCNEENIKIDNCQLGCF